MPKRKGSSRTEQARRVKRLRVQEAAARADHDGPDDLDDGLPGAADEDFFGDVDDRDVQGAARRARVARAHAHPSAHQRAFLHAAATQVDRI